MYVPNFGITIYVDMYLSIVIYSDMDLYNAPNLAGQKLINDQKYVLPKINKVCSHQRMKTKGFLKIHI